MPGSFIPNVLDDPESGTVQPASNRKREEARRKYAVHVGCSPIRADVTSLCSKHGRRSSPNAAGDPVPQLINKHAHASFPTITSATRRSSLTA